MGCTLPIQRGRKQQALAAAGERQCFRLCHVKFANADLCTIKRMTGKNAVQCMYMPQRSILDDCFLCMDGTTRSTATPLKTHVGVRIRAVINIDVAAMNGRSIGGARYLDTSIGRASGHLRRPTWSQKAAQLNCWSTSLLDRTTGRIYGEEDCVGRKKRIRQELKGSWSAKKWGSPFYSVQSSKN